MYVFLLDIKKSATFLEIAEEQKGGAEMAEAGREILLLINYLKRLNSLKFECKVNNFWAHFGC